MLPVGLTLEEAYHLHELEVDPNTKCCWDDWTSIGYPDYLGKYVEDQRIIGRRFIRYKRIDGISEVNDRVVHRTDLENDAENARVAELTVSTIDETQEADEENLNSDADDNQNGNSDDIQNGNSDDNQNGNADDNQNGDADGEEVPVEDPTSELKYDTYTRKTNPTKNVFSLVEYDDEDPTQETFYLAYLRLVFGQGVDAREYCPFEDAVNYQFGYIYDFSVSVKKQYCGHGLEEEEGSDVGT